MCGRIKEPAGRYCSYQLVDDYNISLTTILLYLKFNNYLQLPYNKVTINTYFDIQANTSEQALWEINKLYSIDSYGILVINTHLGLLV